MTELPFPWLGLSILVPLAGAIAIGRLGSADAARKTSVAVCSLVLATTLAAWIEFTRLGSERVVDPWPTAGSIAGGGLLVLDSLSAPLLPLGALLYLLTAVATLRTKIRRFSFAWSLVSLAILLAMLACREPWAIIALLAAATVPPYLELRARRKPTGVYVFHMGLFVLLLTIGWGFAEAEGNIQLHSWWAIAPLLGAIFIRGGIVPLHCWMTDLFEHATFGTALLTVTPIAGAYAALRLVFPIAPVWVMQSIGLVSLATAFYAAGMALIQRDARRFFCYLFISHSALVFAGLESGTPLGLTGALCVWLSVSLSLAGFGLTMRALEARRGRLWLDHFHGGYEHKPILAVCFLLTGLASVGFPGTFGFVGTELLIDGAVQAYPRIGVITAAVAALNGIAVLRVYFLLFTGARRVTSVNLHICPRERFAALTLVALILGAGLYPQPGVASRYRAALQILDERDALAASAGNRYGIRYTPPVQAPASSSAPRRLSGTGGMIHGAQLLGW